jgi:membrane fusion protein, multidrug efflux system
MCRRVWLTAVVLLGVPIAGCEDAKPKLAPTKPPVVLVSLPVLDEISDYEDFTGRTEAVFTVEVRARVTGYLDKVRFEDGTEVNEGDQLFEIDPRPYQAELDRSEATVVGGEAHLTRLEADFRRATNLFNRGAISREEFDRFAGDHAEAVAAVGIARANRDLAKLNLAFTKVTAPISGRLSRRLVDPGNLVKADETPLTTIVSLDPMYIYFDIDERTLLRLRRLVREGKMKSRQEEQMTVMVGLSDEEGFPQKGTINFTDNKVDPSTGTLRVRCVIANPKESNSQLRILSPGLFVHVRLPIGQPRQALLISEQALGTDQGRKFLYVVNDSNEVVYRPVRVGLLNDGLRVIEAGLTKGERVIISGLQRVRPGAKVEPKMADKSTPAVTAAPGGSPVPEAVASKRPNAE